MRTCSGEDGMRGAYSGREPGGIEMKTKMNFARGGASTSKKLLAAIAVLAVAFVVFAAIPAVDATEGETAAATGIYYVGGEGAADTNNGSIEKPFATIGNALEQADVKKIVLKGNLDYNKAGDTVSASAIVISDANKVLEIDLAGYKISFITKNLTGGPYYAIENAGKLTISDSSEANTGAIEIQGYAIGVFGNTGELTINDGTFKTIATNDSDGKNKVFYLLNNNGTVTINGGSFEADDTPGVNSSVIKNGWFDTEKKVSNDLVAWESGKVATMTINNGSFTSENYIKNDDYGVMTINDGSFTMHGSACVYSVNKLTINGGTFVNKDWCLVWAYSAADVTITG